MAFWTSNQVFKVEDLVAENLPSREACITRIKQQNNPQFLKSNSDVFQYRNHSCTHSHTYKHAHIFEPGSDNSIVMTILQECHKAGSIRMFASEAGKLEVLLQSQSHLASSGVSVWTVG